jgi:hypothetical protein
MENCYPSASNQRFNLLDNGLIQFPNTNFCLDAGSNPANGVTMKLWTCYPGLAQQTWTYTPPANNNNGFIATVNSQ